MSKFDVTASHNCLSNLVLFLLKSCRFGIGLAKIHDNAKIARPKPILVTTKPAMLYG